MSNEIPKVYYNQTVEEKKVSGKWWAQPDKQIHESVFPVVDRLIESQAYRNHQNLRFARLYQNMEIISLKAGQYARVPDIKSFMTNRMTFNVIKSCIDSAAAKISKEKPRALFLTENGSWGLQQKGKRLSQYIQGVFADVGMGDGDNKSMYGLGKQCFKDCEVWGTGATYFFSPEDVRAERSMIDEVIVDDIEAMYGQPRQIHRLRQVNRDVLLSLYPKFERQIKDVPTTSSQSGQASAGGDMIDTLESWHLRSGKDASDGKHALCIRNATLVPENYEDDFFPFIFQRWSNRMLGFFGGGLAEELVGIQLEINKILRVIAVSQHLCAVPQVWLEAVNKVPGRTINNEIGGIKYYQGKPPIIITPTAQNPEIYNYLEKLYQRAFEITGISQLSAQGKKPAGVDAAVALRELQQIENERFSIQQSMYEDYYMDATWMIYRLSEKLMKEKKDPVVQFKDGNSMKVIHFSDVYLGGNKFSIRPYPTNFLPSEPGAKLQTVTELTQSGFYSKEEAQELLDYPDLKKVQNIKTAQREDILRVLEKMIETEEYQTPEPYMNLDLAKPLAQSYYLRCRCDEAPENVLELIRLFMEDVKKLIDLRDNPPPAEAPSQPAQTPPSPEAIPPAAPETFPTGVPTSPPQGELLPNNPNIQG